MAEQTPSDTLNNWAEPTLDVTLRYESTSIADDLDSWADAVSKSLTTAIEITIEAEGESWIFGRPFFGYTYGEGTPTLEDAISVSLGGAQPELTQSKSEDLDNWLDASILCYGLNITDDANNLSDSVNTGWSQLFVSEADSLNNWADAISHNWAYLTYSIGDSLNNWADSKTTSTLTPAIFVLAYLLEENNLIGRCNVSVSNPDSSYPPNNAKVLPVGKVARCKNLSSPVKWHFTFPSTITANFIALVCHNISDDATIEIKAGTSFDPSYSLGTMTWAKNVAFKNFVATQSSYNYYKVEITDNSNEDGFIQIGYVVIGELTEAAFNFAYGSSYADKITGLGRKTGPQLIVRKPLSEGMDLNLQFRNLDISHINTLREVFRDQLGATKPFMFLPNKYDDIAVFGRLDGNMLTRTYSTSSIANINVKINGEPNINPVVQTMPIIETTQNLPIGYSFSRSSTAYYKNSDLELVQVASGELRDPHYFDYNRYGILLEDGRTNGWTYSEDLSQSVWTKVRSSISSNATDEPKETPSTTADKLVENSDNNNHYLERSISGSTSDRMQSFSGFFKAAEREGVTIQTQNKAGSYWTSRIDLSDGSIYSQDSNHNLLVEKYADDWYRVLLSFDVGSGASTPRVIVYLANPVGTETYQGNGSSGIYIWGLQIEIDKEFPSSYIVTTGSTTSRVKEEFNVPFDFIPQPMTIYLKTIEIGNVAMTTVTAPRIFELCYPGWNDIPKLTLYWTGNYYQLWYETEEGAVQSTIGQPDLGDEVEFRCVLYPNGDCRLYVTVNGGVEQWGPLINNTLPTYWENGGILKLNYGYYPLDYWYGVNIFESVKTVRGVKSLEEMRKL